LSAKGAEPTRLSPRLPARPSLERLEEVDLMGIVGFAGLFRGGVRVKHSA